jgi:hypothetical protein
MTIDMGRLKRLKGMMEASASAEPNRGLVASYSRIRSELIGALGDAHADEIGRLFPERLSTADGPWGPQSKEVQTHFAQMAGWLGGIIGEDQQRDRSLAI